jgi:carbonic anhydrase
MRKTATRCFLGLLLAAFVAGLSHAADNARDPGSEALRELREGNLRFVRGNALHPRQNSERRRQTERLGQSPKALVLACSDSRVPVEMIFDQGIGNVFVARVAGNVPGAGVLGTIDTRWNISGFR